MYTFFRGAPPEPGRRPLGSPHSSSNPERKGSLSCLILRKVPNGPPTDLVDHLPIPWTNTPSKKGLIKLYDGRAHEGGATDSFHPGAVPRHVHTVGMKTEFRKGTRRQKKNHFREKTIGATVHYTNFSTFHFYESEPFFQLNLMCYLLYRRQVNKKEKQSWMERGRKGVCPPQHTIAQTFLTPKMMPQETPKTTPGVLGNSLKTKVLI